MDRRCVEAGQMNSEDDTMKTKRYNKKCWPSLEEMGLWRQWTVDEVEDKIGNVFKYVISFSYSSFWEMQNLRGFHLLHIKLKYTDPTVMWTFKN